MPATRIEASLRETCSSGFINFFGTQRVGSPSAFARGQPLPYQVRGIVAGIGGGRGMYYCVVKAAFYGFVDGHLSCKIFFFFVRSS